MSEAGEEGYEAGENVSEEEEVMEEAKIVVTSSK